MGRQAWIEHDYIDQTRRNLFQALGNFVSDVDKPTRQCAAALRRSQPFVKTRWSAKPRE